MKQTRKDDGQVEAPVEAVLNLGELAMSIFGEIERMVGACKGGLEIAQQGVDRLDLLDLDAGCAAASDGSPVSGTADGDGLEAPQPLETEPC